MKILVCCLLVFYCIPLAYGQQITGIWKGRIHGKSVELKIIQKGDSITGTSYYPGLLKSNLRRYVIKGYFDGQTNSVVWWDDALISSKAAAADRPFMSVADFNCPGSGRMFLNGEATDKAAGNKGVVNLTKVNRTGFADEWDFVLDNFGVGGNDPGIIDSIGKIALLQKGNLPIDQPQQPLNKPEPVATLPAQKKPVTNAEKVEKQLPLKTVIAKPALNPPTTVVVNSPESKQPLTTHEMFTTRKKILNKEIPLVGDSIELHFYDNAEVDGDSISLYLNDKLIFTHIRLTANAYKITLPLKDLLETNELVMVAENLGSIPPNTAFMIAFNGTKRYEAQLESTENSSCLIRLSKE